MHTFEISQEHIGTGRPKAPCRCPIAVSMCEAEGIDDPLVAIRCGSVFLLPVMVGGDHIVYRGEKYISSVALGEWIAAFDEGQEVAPFELMLDGVIADIRSKGECNYDAPK